MNAVSSFLVLLLSLYIEIEWKYLCLILTNDVDLSLEKQKCLKLINNANIFS